MNAYQERLDKLNKKPENWTVIDSVDRPIRQLVLEMNRVGLSTVWSCCGFNYDQEEEPKSHANKPYVGFNIVVNREDKIVKWLEKVAKKIKWKLHKFEGSSAKWQITASDLEKYQDFWVNKDKHLNTSIHRYEICLARIRDLHRIISRIPTYKEEFEILDGNQIIKNLDPYFEKEWQIQPKKPTKISLAVETETGELVT